MDRCMEVPSGRAWLKSDAGWRLVSSTDHQTPVGQHVYNKEELIIAGTLTLIPKVWSHLSSGIFGPWQMVAVVGKNNSIL